MAKIAKQSIKKGSAKPIGGRIGAPNQFNTASPSSGMLASDDTKPLVAESRDIGVPGSASFSKTTPGTEQFAGDNTGMAKSGARTGNKAHSGLNKVTMSKPKRYAGK